MPRTWEYGVRGGTDNVKQEPGIWKFQNNRWTLVADIPTNQPNDSVEHLAYLGGNGLLAAVNGYDEVYIGRGTTWNSIPTPQAMHQLQSHVNALAAYDGDLIVGATNGLLCYQPSTGNWVLLGGTSTYPFLNKDAMIQKVKEIMNPALKPGTPQNIAANIQRIMSLHGSGFVPNAPQSLSTNDILIMGTLEGIMNQQPGLMSTLQSLYKNSAMMGTTIVDQALSDQQLGFRTDEELLVENYGDPSNRYVISYYQATLRALNAEISALGSLEQDYNNGDYSAVNSEMSIIDNLAIAEGSLAADVNEYFPG